MQHCKEYIDNKDWLGKLKNGFSDTEGKTANLFIKVTCKGDVVHEKEFLKEGCYKMIGNNWHEPVDDPQIAIYTQFGADNTHKNTYGTARGYTHVGLDIFSIEGENAYACLDAEVFEIQKWTRTKGDSGYDHNITLKVKNPQEVKNRRREYTLAYKTDKKQGGNFNPKSEVFLLRYAHLKDILVKKGQKVKVGDVIGKTGISGVIEGTKDPHLHFNMYSDKKSNPYLVNPAYYVYWKEIGDLTEADKKIQKDRMEEGIKTNAAPKLSKIK
ncbi:M23 family metallopeptidase [Tenacibaculum ovolyticum]|uniref:M23 family metallopeptidase n=1 Tax=Tenacibaculum ovolyticum TaxID=104270 RepID=UPI0007ED2D1E|nr:M23 family metallopeptidase [Tenacibaculum ovolyticum]